MVRLNVSVPDDLGKYLLENPDLSPSKMLQAQIMQVRTNRDTVFKEIAELQRKCNHLKNEVNKLLDFLTKKELIDEFYKI